MIIARGKSREDLGEGVDHGAIILGGHGAHKAGVEIIDIRNKNILNQLEGADVEGTGQIGVHGARGEIGKGREAENIVGDADFFGEVQVVNLEWRIKNGRLDGVRGSGALPLAAYVAFVGGSREQEMVADKARRETRDSHQFFALLKCPQQCRSGGRAESLVDKLHLFRGGGGLALAAISVGGCTAGMSVGVVVAIAASGINHSPVRVHLLAHRTMRPRCKMVHSVLMNALLQPALHSVTTKMREWDAKLGMMWAWQAAGGSAGMSNVHVCVDFTRSPLGRRAMMGVAVG